MERAASVDHGAASVDCGPWSTAMSSVYDASKCLPCVDDILTFPCVNREYCTISFPDGGGLVLRRRREDLGWF